MPMCKSCPSYLHNGTRPQKNFRDSTVDRTSDLWSSIWSSISGSKPETPALYSVRYMYMLFLNILQYTQFYQLLPNHILTKTNWLCGEKRNYSLTALCLTAAALSALTGYITTWLGFTSLSKLSLLETPTGRLENFTCWPSELAMSGFVSVQVSDRNVSSGLVIILCNLN